MSEHFTLRAFPPKPLFSKIIYVDRRPYMGSGVSVFYTARVRDALHPPVGIPLAALLSRQKYSYPDCQFFPFS